MKPIFVAAIRKYMKETQAFLRRCRQSGIPVQTAGKVVNQMDTPTTEKEALIRAFHRINRAELVYIIAPTGYTGRTVSIEMGYAHAKGKPIISSHLLEEFSARALVSKIESPESLLIYLRKRKK